jgi:DNA replication protein DnaC
LGPPGTGKSHLAIAIAIRACLAGQRVLSHTATEWVARLAEAQRAGKLAAEIIRLGRDPLLASPCAQRRRRPSSATARLSATG